MRILVGSLLGASLFLFYPTQSLAVPSPAIAKPLLQDRAASRQQEPQNPITEQQLRGVWSKYEAKKEGDLVRFYYFHSDGIGLYRYGRLGLTYTNSFNYRVEKNQLILTFRKTGEKHVIPIVVEKDPKNKQRTWLTLGNDPREKGTSNTYFRDARGRETTMDATFQELTNDPIFLQLTHGSSIHPSAPNPNNTNNTNSANNIGNRLWIDEKKFATGGMGFSMYQLLDTAIDGRGVGWFHQGDYDDWSTESLSYRIIKDRIEIKFGVRSETHTVHWSLENPQDPKQRTLVIDDDPRNFWQYRKYADKGPSFSSR